MNDSKDEQPLTASMPSRGVVASTLDMVTDLVTQTSIPAPVKRNALKAFDRLCTAAIEIPAAYLEGIASEKRAETAARIKIISKSGDQIADQMRLDPEYARVAINKFGQRVIREQINLDMISEGAAKELKEQTSTPAPQTASPETETINDDWLSNFEKEACQKSTEDMQRMFARVLAGEIKRPSSFSIKSVKLLGELDQTTATLFATFCSACIFHKVPKAGIMLDGRVPSLNGNPNTNSLLEYGLSYGSLNVLQEHGLIISDYNSWMVYQLVVAQLIDGRQHVLLPFQFQNRMWGLIPLADRDPKAEVKIHGVALTKSGQQLASIVDIPPNEKFETALKNYFASQKLGMVEVPTRKPKPSA